MPNQQDLLIQHRLREGQKLVDFTGPPFYMKVTRHKRYDNLVHFKYDQIRSPLSNPFIQQCRGLILDENNAWKCISRPFDKFFNYGEFLASSLDWKQVRVFEKLDGTMCQMYHYRDEWHVGTTGTPDASGVVGMNGTMTFEELFWKTWKSTGKGVLPLTHENTATFLFELMTPMNRVVVDHKESKLQLIGVRHRDTGEEFTPGYWKHLDPVKEFNFNEVSIPYKQGDIKALMDTFKDMKPLEQEGYVVQDRYFRRVKVKHPGYVTLHHTISHFNDKSLFDIIRQGESEEVVAVFPQWKSRLDELKLKYTRFVYDATIMWNMSKNITNQKEFALKIKDLPFCSILFRLRGGTEPDVETVLRCMTIERFMELIDRWERKVVV